MAGNWNITMTGVQRTIKVMSNLIGVSVLEKAALKAGFLIEKEAVKIITRLGHVDTGRLRSSIKTVSKKQGRYEVIVRVGTDVFYSIFVEALPDGGYLYPAYRGKKKAAMALIKKDIQNALKIKGYIN